jgi:RNA polymerase sigma-70 factor, ECF subfamily
VTILTSPSEITRAPDDGHPELASVIRMIAAGEHSVMTRLYDLTNHLIYGFVIRILRDAPAAEEVLLDIYLQVWKQASRYDDTRGSPLAWMLTIARSRAIDRLRAERQEQRNLEPLAESVALTASIAPEQNEPFAEVRASICSALSVLPAAQRRAIEMAFYEGFTHNEISRALEQPLGTVKSNIRRGMIHLRKIIDPAYHNFSEGRLATAERIG